MNKVDAMTVVSVGIRDAFPEGSEERDAWEQLARLFLEDRGKPQRYNGWYVPPEHDCRTACLPKVPRSEPIFILRAQDKIAPTAVRS